MPTHLDARANTIDGDGEVAIRVVGSGIAGSLGQTTMSESQPVTIASDQSALDVTMVNGSGVEIDFANPSTGTLANVGDAATSTTLIASNSARKGAVIVNDSTSVLYVKFGSSASATSYTYYMAGTGGGAPAQLEIPYGYTGIITGFWVSDAGGNARVTELT